MLTDLLPVGRWFAGKVADLSAFLNRWVDMLEDDPWP